MNKRETIFFIQDTGIPLSMLRQNMEILKILDSKKIKYVNFGIINDGLYKIFSPLQDIELIKEYVYKIDKYKIVILGSNHFLNRSIFRTQLELDIFNCGIYFNNFKFKYSTYFDKVPIFNNDFVRYYSINTEMERTFDKDMFIRPNGDGKFFKSGIIKSNTKIRDYISDGWLKNDSDFIVASVKNIDSEYRFICKDKGVITGSRYALSGEFNPSEEIPFDVSQKALEIVKLYQPSKYFVVDLAVSGNDISVVEFNCINCSGFYESNLEKIIDSFI